MNQNSNVTSAGIATKTFQGTFDTAGLPTVVSQNPIIVHGVVFSGTNTTGNEVDLNGFNDTSTIYGTFRSAANQTKAFVLQTPLLAHKGLQIRHPSEGTPTLGPNYEFTVFFSQVGR